jgi:hypothetical protein
MNGPVGRARPRAHRGHVRARSAHCGYGGQLVAEGAPAPPHRADRPTGAAEVSTWPRWRARSQGPGSSPRAPTASSGDDRLGHRRGARDGPDHQRPLGRAGAGRAGSARRGEPACGRALLKPPGSGARRVARSRRRPAEGLLGGALRCPSPPPTPAAVGSKARALDGRGEPAGDSWHPVARALRTTRMRASARGWAPRGGARYGCLHALAALFAPGRWWCQARCPAGRGGGLTSWGRPVLDLAPVLAMAPAGSGGGDRDPGGGAQARWAGRCRAPRASGGRNEGRRATITSPPRASAG